MSAVSQVPTFVVDSETGAPSPGVQRLSQVALLAGASELALLVDRGSASSEVDIGTLIADLADNAAVVVRGVDQHGGATLGAVALLPSFALAHDREAAAGELTLSLVSPVVLVRVESLGEIPAEIADLGGLACGWVLAARGRKIVLAHQQAVSLLDPCSSAADVGEVMLSSESLARWRVGRRSGASRLSIERRLELRLLARLARTVPDRDLVGAGTEAPPRRPRHVPEASRAAARRSTVAIVCSDVLGRSMAGPAIRSVELGRVLAEIAEVRLAVRELHDAPELPFSAEVLTPDRVDELLGWADVVVVQGPATDWYPAILASDVAIAIDLYDPFNLEALEHPDATHRVPYATRVLLDQVDRGDFFFCASDRQRDYWLGMLSAAGRVTPAAYAADPDLRLLVDNVPFGLPADPPRVSGPGPRAEFAGIGADDPLLLWNGGLWDWFDPELFIRAVDRARRDVPNIRALFMGVRRPDQTGPDPEPVRRVIDLARELGLWETHVFARGWTPYADRQNVYRDATAVVSLHRSHVETRFSFRSRLLDCIWASMPIVCTDGDVLAATVVDERIGLTVRAGDLDGAAAALVEICTNVEMLTAMQGRLVEIAPAWTWENAASPLMEFVRNPRRTAPPLHDQREAHTFDGRQGPPPGSLKLLVPTPVRKHVLGPLKRTLLAPGPPRT